jgi:hypothetical protein
MKKSLYKAQHSNKIPPNRSKQLTRAERTTTLKALPETTRPHKPNSNSNEQQNKLHKPTT